MIKVQNNTATRDPIPPFLYGLAPESLLDLSWTDPALGVADAAWWPEVDESPALSTHERYGAETLTVDAEAKVVRVVRAVVPWSDEEIEAERKARVPASVSPRQIRQALTRTGLRSQVEAAVAAGDQDLKDWWEFATDFQRANPHVLAMAAALGVTERQLDDLWTLAAGL